LADLLDVEFRFTWPRHLVDDESHAIGPADEFFSAAFTAAHEVDHDATEHGFALPTGPADDLDSLRGQLASAQGGLLAPNRSLVHRVDPQAVPAILGGYASEFARIGFHPRISTAISGARAVPLGADTVAIHLRAGDLIHGHLRTWNRFADKVIAAPIARTLIERHVNDGRTVLVFGQDTELIEELCSSTGAIDAGTLRPDGEMTRAAEAMFDIVLMSRCSNIIGGKSGFAIQAAFLGNQQLDFHHDLVSATEAIDITRADMALHGARYPPAHRAFAWWAAYYRARRRLTNDEAIDLVSSALEADPSNPRFRLRLAALAYREGRRSEGDEMLNQALISDVARGATTLQSVLLLSMTTTARVFDSRDIIDDIEGAADGGSGIAALYRAGLRAARGDHDGAARDVATFEAQAAGDGQWGPLDALRSQIRATLAERRSEAGRPV
jgi:tetratricopeptide (TPR) repeat protein